MRHWCVARFCGGLAWGPPEAQHRHQSVWRGQGVGGKWHYSLRVVQNNSVSNLLRLHFFGDDICSPWLGNSHPQFREFRTVAAYTGIHPLMRQTQSKAIQWSPKWGGLVLLVPGVPHYMILHSFLYMLGKKRKDHSKTRFFGCEQQGMLCFDPRPYDEKHHIDRRKPMSW